MNNYSFFGCPKFVCTMQSSPYWFYTWPVWVRVFLIIFFPYVFIAVALWPKLNLNLVYKSLMAIGFGLYLFTSIFGFAATPSDEKDGQVLGVNEESISKISELEENLAKVETEKIDIETTNAELQTRVVDLENQLKLEQEAKAVAETRVAELESQASTSTSSSNTTAKTPAPANSTTPTSPAPASSAPSQPKTAYDHSGNNYNCGDFSSKTEAVTVYQESLRVAGYDIHRLDGDSDGDPCESL
jgi:hypothetical protein